MAKTIILSFRDWRGFVSFSDREYETMKEARKDLKEFAKDKQFFNNSSETPTGYEDCVEIRLIVNGEIEDCKATAWAAEILKKYEEPEVAPAPVPEPVKTVTLEQIKNWLTAKKEPMGPTGDEYYKGWDSAINHLVEHLFEI